MLTIQLKIDDPTESTLDDLLPSGYRVESLGGGRFAIMTENTNLKVGQCSEEREFVEISFYDETAEGSEFAAAFGLLHPEHNPTQVLYGVVYSLGGNVYNLDKRPVTLKSVLEAEIGHYSGSGNAYFVSFKNGNKGPNWIHVDEIRKIELTGILGIDFGPKFLALGDIENEETM